MGIAERRQREMKRREQEILDAALALSQGDDWFSVTVEQIAEKAEIGKGTVYKHFESKDEIYGMLMLEYQRLVLRDLKRIDPALDVIGRLRAVIRVYWFAHVNRPEYQRILEYTLRESFRRSMSPRLLAEWQEIGSALNAIFFGIIQAGISDGTFPDRPPAALLVGPQATVNGMVMMLWAGCAEQDAGESILEEISRFVVAGMTAPVQPTPTG